MVDLSTELRSIISLLSTLPIMADESNRRAVAIRSGLDSQLISQMNFNGSVSGVVTHMIGLLTSYGQLEDGRDPLEAFLTEVNANIGVDKKEIVDKFLTHWHSLPAEKRGWSANLQKYLNHIVFTWEHIESPLLPQNIRLSQIAAKLHISDTGNKSGNVASVKLPGYKKRDLGPSNSQSFDLGELIASLPDEDKWVILGDPGTGKTTLLAFEAARLASAALKDARCLMPVVISLANFSSQSEKQFGYSIYDHITAIGKNIAVLNLGDEVYNLAVKGKVIFLLDGLDEISDSVRKLFIDRIETSIPGDIGNRIVYTSRKVGFSGLSSYNILEIDPLSINEQRKLMLAICGEEKTALLLKNIAGRRDLQDLASVPMALTVLALVARESGDEIADYLHRQADLLQVGIQILLEGRHKGGSGVINPERAEDILARASFQLHAQLAKMSKGEYFTLREFEQAVELVEPQWLLQWQGARNFINDVSSHSNIVYPVDTLKRHYRYLHRTFREFLAALEMSKLGRAERREIVSGYVTKQEWAEVLVLLGGLTSDIDDYLYQLLSGPPDLALRTLREVKKLTPALATQILELKSARLRDRRQVFSQLAIKLSRPDLVIDVLRAYLESTAPHTPRADLYFIQEILKNYNLAIARDLLASILEYLPPVPDKLLDLTLPSIGDAPYWCSVPRGEFLMGASSTDPDKPSWVLELTNVYVSSFSIARVPVTNQVYEAFDPSHREERDFQDDVSAQELDHHPVVKVSWYEAVLFCQWISQRYPGARLPTEAEWEKAASWTASGEKRKFPWGNDWDPSFLNSWHLGPNRTTRVGMYPNGKSPWEVLDMAGNVWEWCFDGFEEEIQDTIKRLTLTPQNPQGPQSCVRRVDRGGGWYQDVGHPCTFLRAADDPADIFSHCGFRLAFSEQIH